MVVNDTVAGGYAELHLGSGRGSDAFFYTNIGTGIGGGVANMGEYIVEPIRRYANEYVFISGRDRFEVVTCELLDNNVPLGAALFAIHGFEGL